MEVDEARKEARYKALESLAKYKFVMFGYYAALWVSLNRLATYREPNPFACFVNQARLLK